MRLSATDLLWKKLEDQLDDITSGKEDWIKVLANFWSDFYSNVSSEKEKIPIILE